jgi:P27 family predicted phage terminase small subunit
MPGTKNSGRRKKPTRELQISGSRWAKGRKDNPIAVAVLSIDQPHGYTEKEKEIFKFYSQCLMNQRALAAGDVAILDTFTRTYAELGELEEDIKTNGRVYIAPDGQERTRAVVRQRNECRRELRSLASQLGLSPSSRGGIQPIDSVSKNPFINITK